MASANNLERRNTQKNQQEQKIATEKVRRLGLKFLFSTCFNTKWTAVVANFTQ